MPYILSEISENDIKKILEEADPRKRQILLRRDHFEIPGNISWAIDTSKNHYLFLAPPAALGELEYTYYFFFENKMYSIGMKAPTGPKIFFNEKIDLPEEKFVELKKDIEEAFRIYGPVGVGATDEVWSFTF